METQWFKLLKMNWPGVTWLRTEADVITASGEIKMAMGRRSPTNSELCDVIRWMSGPDCDQDRAPSLRQLIMWVYKYRKGETDEGGSDATGCDLCAESDGWIYPRTNFRRNHRLGVPCTCAAGDNIINTCKPYKDMSAMQLDSIMRLRELAAGAVRSGSVMRCRTGGEDAAELFDDDEEELGI